MQFHLWLPSLGRRLCIEGLLWKLGCKVLANVLRLMQGGSASSRTDLVKLENLVLKLRERIEKMADQPETIASRLDQQVQARIQSPNQNLWFLINFETINE